ncbi:MAG: DNA-3-methyladenine glycosylase I [Actinobacteria bacterium]|nr:DNA-3-methyladenine glycosylase I [Actinomycetota bacterium]MDQ3216987.1 DNA-3-methyladenine glycosylase I [Actinomycetota bacterium]
MRCEWAQDGDPLYLAYHDEEWGVPSHDDRHLFEMLVLEGAQAGLSWATVLAKREGYRRAFCGFDPGSVASFEDEDVQRLLGNASIVRNRRKIESALDNARATIEIQAEFGSLDRYLWGLPRHSVESAPRSIDDVPSETEASRAMSRELKRRGFRFVGPTICYAFMQAVGMVNDHTESCFRRREISNTRPYRP